MRQPPGSRQGTAARGGPPNTSGVGYNTNMSISDRPVTQQGLSGMRTAGMGPQRQIQDNSYYLTLLRQKCTEIMKEIEVLKGTVEQGQKDNAAYGLLERKYESLTNEMRGLQGKLADYNLLLDRSRAHREVDEVMDEVHQLANQNQMDRGRVDELFQHRSALEGQGRDVEAQLMRQHNELAERLEQVNPQMKDEFLKLSQKQQVLSVQEIPKRQSDLAFFEERVREMEAAVSRDPYRAKAFRLREDMMRLERAQAALHEELDGPQLTEEQQRELLLQRVKADNASIAEHERALAESQEAIRSGKKQLSQLKSDMTEANDPKAQKYQELFERDKEMTQLIDTFEPTKVSESAKIERAQAEVVRLLQSVSRRMAMTENTDMMSKSKLDEMNDDLEFKQSQMDHSISTSERLQRELQQRKLELEKIESLDEKISVEITQLEEKKDTMDKELETYEDIGKLRSDADTAKDEAREKKARAESQIGELKKRAAQKKKQWEGLKQQLSSDDVAVSLDEYEQKMRHHEQTVWVLTEYIETKGAESHFEGVAEECLGMLNNINNESIQALKDRPIHTLY
jgi:intraflagellar transport protein 74